MRVWCAGELLAVKRIHFDNITRDELAAIEQEILLLQKLRHEHIVSYMAIDITDTNLNILMEFCPGGSVAHLLRHLGPSKKTCSAPTPDRYRHTAHASCTARGESCLGCRIAQRWG